MVYKNLYTLCFLYGITEKKGKKKTKTPWNKGSVITRKQKSALPEILLFLWMIFHL